MNRQENGEVNRGAQGFRMPKNASRPLPLVLYVNPQEPAFTQPAMLVEPTSCRIPSPRRSISSDQVERVFKVMKILRDDDMLNGVSPKEMKPCDPCGQERPKIGSVRYGSIGVDACNGCATTYELLQLSGYVKTPEQYFEPKKV